MTAVSLNFDFSGSVPETPAGQMTSVIMVSRSKHGEFCFAGYYLNRYPLEFEEPPEGAEESDDGGYLTTGWYYDNSNFEYEDCYYPVAGEVLAWARMPKAADVLAPSPSPSLTVLLPSWKEQAAFEEWANEHRYEMDQHPHHYLFLNKQTDAARQGWKAALDFVRKLSEGQP